VTIYFIRKKDDLTNSHDFNRRIESSHGIVSKNRIDLTSETRIVWYLPISCHAF